MNEFFMEEALKEAQKACKIREVPVGAVIVYRNNIISRGYNLKEKKQDATMHAEVIAIKKASKKLKSWRLDECDLYVTLEPCTMCAGAAIAARINNIFFGAYDVKAGALISKVKLGEKGLFNHNINFEGGLMEGACSQLLKDFFKEQRKI